jgi:chromosome partitioning protein
MERALPRVARMSAVTIALANQKGGVGKTTSAVNLSVLLARAGYRVLLIDNDPQGNATSSLGIDKADLPLTTYNILVDGLDISRVARETGRPHLSIVPATPLLAGAEVELVEIPNRERRLVAAIAAAQHNYDLIIIDCPPARGRRAVNSLTAADLVIVPIQCEFLALEGVGQLITTIDLVKRQLNPDLDIIGVLMTMFDGRTRLSQMVVDEVRAFFPHRIFDTVIPRSVRLAEAPSYGQSILEYDRASRGANAYEAVAGELLQRLGLPETRELNGAQADALAAVNQGSDSIHAPQEGEAV